MQEYHREGSIIMKITWVILTWNSAGCIQSCIDSILCLKKIENQIIVIDNGSTDNTVQILEKYKEKIELIRFCKNQGTTVSRNEGIKRADKDVDYICILDSDTEVNDEAIIKLTASLQNDDKVMIAGPKLVTRSGVEQPSARAFPTLTTKVLKACPIKKVEELGRRMEQCRNAETRGAFQADVIMSACWMIKPQLIEEIGMLDEYYFYSPEDTEYCLRTQKAGYKVLYCPDAVILHEWQRLSKKKLISKVNFESLKGHIHMFRKYHYCFSVKKLKGRIGQ